MSSAPQGGASKRRWKRVALAAAVAALLAAALWWWWRAQAGAGEQTLRLQAVVERGRLLEAELANFKPPEPPVCPPGQSVKTVPPGAVLEPAAPSALPAPASAGSGSAANDAVPAAASAAGAAGTAAVLPDHALAQHLELVTAMVMVMHERSLGTGTGFFIAPNLLVTNRHVVEKAGSGRIFLVSKALGSVRKATVLSTTQSSEPGSPDFALLRMEEGTAPGVLDMTEGVSKLAAVVAAGFPAVVVQGDANFQRLLGGDVSAAPDLNLTQGAVQSLQSGASGTPLIVHTASIAQGNSGGPLVDACGRLVGVNTYIHVDQTQSSKINYAIRAQVMAAFITSVGAKAPADARVCGARG